jgi:outer membrane cobalamin receptor
MKRILLFVLLFPCVTLYPQEKPDTTRTYSVPEVVVSERYRTREIRAAAPLQTLDRKALKNLGALQVSDAVKYFAGVTVKDYGGIGGLKTVALRGLGAEHTAVSYDGIAVSNTQTGQIDLGRFSLDYVDRLSLSNGQSDDIFRPARLFASAGVLNIQTLTPTFTEGKSLNIAAALKTGSWGMINPSVRLEHKLSSRWAWTANVEGMSADGRYPYTMHYGGAQDSISHEKRKNTEVSSLRAESELFGNFSDTEQWRLKAYFYQSSRGLPNATTLYYDYA